jgi:galactokinase
MADESLLAIAIETYRKSFGRNPDTAAFAPGRVNLIGEHTDYNDGFVLPFALPLQTVVVGSKVTGPDSSLISCSMKDADPVMFQVNSSLCKGEPTWANYVKGTVFQYLGNLPDGFAFNAVVMSNVPIGSGLSSSASLE